MKKLVHYLSAAIVTILGFSVMLAWISHHYTFASVDSFFLPMQFNASLCFFLSGISLLLMTHWNRLSGIIGFFVLILGLLTLLEYITLIDLHIDQLAIKGTLTGNSSHIGRMPPNTALCFVFTGLMLIINGFFYKKRWVKQFAVFFAITIGLQGIFSLIGHIFGIKAIYSLGNLSAMGLHTTLGFIVIAVSALAIYMDDFARFKILKSFLLSIIVGAIGFFIFLIGWQILVNYENAHTKEFIEREANMLQLQIQSVMGENFNSIKRIFSRVRNVSNDDLENVKKDYLSFMKDHKGIEVLVSPVNINNKIKILEFTRLPEKITNEAITQCKSILLGKKSDDYFSVSATQQYFCIGNPELNQLAIYDLKTLFKFILHDSILGKYNIVLSDNQKIYYSQVIDYNDFFEKEWKVKKYFSLIGKKFELSLSPTESFVREKSSNFPVIFLVVGLSIVIFLVILVRLLQISIQKNKVIQEAQRKFFNLINGSPEAIIGSDRKGRIKLANKQAIHLFGYSEKEFQVMKIESLMSKNFREYHAHYLSDYMKNPQVRRISESNELSILTKDEKTIPVEISLTPIEMGGKVAVLSTIVDISERKGYEKRIEEESKKIQLIYEATMLVSEVSDDKKAMELCLDLICKSINWPIGHIYILEMMDKPVLVSSKIWYVENPEKITEFKRKSEETKFQKGVGLPGRIWESKKPEWIFDVYSDPNFLRALQSNDIGVKSGIGFPIIVNKEIVAVFEFFSYELRTIDEKLIRTFEVMSNQIGRVFERKMAQQQLEHYAIELKKTNKSLEYLAHHDYLTGIYNRVQFEILAKESIARAERYMKSMAIMIFDIDYFKNVNDTLGHEVGDKLLKEIVDRLLAAIRKVDVLARIGGDEFAIIIDSIDQLDQIRFFARKILEVISKPFEISGYKIFTSLSIGIATYPSGGNTLSSLMKNADLALYQAKEEGKNRFCFFSKELNTQVNRKMQIEDFIRDSIAQEKFTLKYQPVFNLQGENANCVEIFLHYPSSTIGVIPIDQLIVVAEEAGLIVPLGKWVIETAFQELNRLEKATNRKIKMSINLSRKQIIQNEFIQWLSDTLQKYDVDPKLIIFEISENAVMQNIDTIEPVMKELIALGVSIYIDNFGTGYSGMNMLKKLAVSGVKLDRTIIQEISDDPKIAGLVKLLYLGAIHLGLTVIYVGVENQAQVDVLRSFSQDQKAQGYFFKSPMSAEEMEAFFKGL